MDNLKRGDRLVSHGGVRILFLCILVLIPWAMVPVPPLLDYINHMARLWLISGGIDTAPLNTYYTFDWHGLATNIAIDLTAATFGPLIGAQTLSRLLLALAILVPPLGGICLHRRLYGKWSSWQILFLFFWCTITLLAGFLNFQLSLGLALFAALADTYLMRMPLWLRLTCRILFGIALILAHPFGLMFYGALLAALSYGPAPAGQKRPILRGGGALLTACIIFIPVIGAAVWTGSVPGIAPGEHFAYLPDSPLQSLQVIQSPFYAYAPIVDAPLEILFILGAAYMLLQARTKATHGGMMLMAGILWVLSLLMPQSLGQATWVDHRLPIMAIYVSLLAVAPQPSPDERKYRTYAPIIAAALVMIRTGWIGWNWQGGWATLATTQSALAAMPEGARLLAVQNQNNHFSFRYPGRTLHYREDFRNYAAMAVIWRHAFVPTLFAEPGQQPLRFRTKYASVRGGSYLCPVQGLTDVSQIPQGDQFMRHWRSAFDYVLLLNADRKPEQGATTLPPELRLVRDTGFARLYKIAHKQMNSGAIR